MIAPQIQALYFPGCSRRRMNQRLQQLGNTGFIVRRPMPLGLSAGLPLSSALSSVPFVYGLGGAAAPIVAAQLGWDVSDVRRVTRMGTPTAIAHTLESVRLRLQAEQAVREQKVNSRENKGVEAKSMEAGSGEVVLEYLPERLLGHRYGLRAPGGQWKNEHFKPDALIKLAWSGGPWRHWFVEIDLGHTASAEWEKKADVAVRYRTLGLFQRRYGADGYGTLVVTTGDRRRAHLQHLLARRFGPEDAAHFGVTTFSEVASRGLLAPIWHMPGCAAMVSLETWPETLEIWPESPDWRPMAS